LEGVGCSPRLDFQLSFTPRGWAAASAIGGLAALDVSQGAPMTSYFPIRSTLPLTPPQSTLTPINLKLPLLRTNTGLLALAGTLALDDCVAPVPCVDVLGHRIVEIV